MAEHGASHFPPPGTLLPVEGRLMHVHTTGAGAPVVVLEAGFGNDSLIWSLVQPGIAAFTQVCSYDRAGMGWSEPADGLRTSEAIARELHPLLGAAHLSPPYVLVGHSMGGLYVRQFARLFRAHTAGLVLVDSAHENLNGRLPEAVRAHDADMDAARLAQFEALAQMTHADIVQAMRRPDDQPSPFPPEIDALRRDRARPAVFRAMAAEYAHTDALLSQGEAALGDFGDLPVIVLTAAHSDPDPDLSEALNAEVAAVLATAQADLARISSNSQQLVVPCGHFIQVEQPHVVVEAVRRMVAHLREGAPLLAS
jgi:pimeloyl-ACP methyl ester carboxylesterase